MNRGFPTLVLVPEKGVCHHHHHPPHYHHHHHPNCHSRHRQSFNYFGGDEGGTFSNSPLIPFFICYACFNVLAAHASGMYHFVFTLESAHARIFTFMTQCTWHQFALNLYKLMANYIIFESCAILKYV